MQIRKLIIVSLISIPFLQKAMEEETRKIIPRPSTMQLNPTPPYAGPSSKKINAAAYIKQYSMIATASNRNRLIELWQAQDPYKKVAQATNPDNFASFTFVQNANSYVATPAGENIAIWDIQNLTLLTTLKGHSKPVNTLNFNPLDATQLISGSEDQTIKFWDLKSGTCTNTITNNGWIMNATYSPNAQQVAFAANAAPWGQVWDLTANKQLYTMFATMVVAYNKQNTQLAVGQGPIVGIFQPQLGTLVEKIKSNGKWYTSDPNTKDLANALSLDYSPDGTQLAMGTDSDYLTLANPNENQEPYCFNASVVFTNTTQFNNDGSKLLTASWQSNDEGSTIRIWDLNMLKTKNSRWCSLQ